MEIFFFLRNPKKDVPNTYICRIHSNSSWPGDLRTNSSFVLARCVFEGCMGLLERRKNIYIVYKRRKNVDVCSFEIILRAKDVVEGVAFHVSKNNTGVLYCEIKWKQIKLSVAFPNTTCIC